MAIGSKAIKDLVNAITSSENDVRSSKHSAVVSRIDNEGVIWVRVAGSERETPTASTTAEVNVNDVVNVEWRNNKLYIAGNSTNPSVGYNTVMPSVDYVNQLVDKDITVKSIKAATGYIDDLHSKNITTENLQANTAYIKDLLAENIAAEDIISDHAAIGSLDADYAKINAANIDAAAIQDAWINKLLVQTGLIAHAGTVFTLDAIQVNAANITAGTLDVNRLIVTVEGQKYLVNIDPSTGTPSYQKLDGNIVEPRTITADKIVAGAITTNEITTNNLQGTSGWINLHEGKFFYGDGANFASATNAIEWNGSKLQIKADEFLLSSGKSIFEEMEAIETWFYAVPPTTSNEPAVNWTTGKLKEMHLRDIYFDTESGKSYRWALTSETGVTPKVYGWVEIEDVQYNALAGRVSTAETNISSNSRQIALKANATDVYKKNETYSKTETDSAITQSASEIDISVTQKISNIQVGGKNLLRGTDKLEFKSPVTWKNAGYYKSGTGGSAENVTLPDSPVSGVEKGIKITITTANTQMGFAQSTVPLRKAEVTQSVWVKGTAGSKIELQPVWNGTSGQQEGGRKAFIIEDSDWHRYEFTKELNYDHLDGANTAAGYVYVFSNTIGDIFYVCADKLEYGNKATDWTPAPEDLEDYADNAVSEAKSEIKVTTDGISTEVSKKVGNSEVISKINQSAESVRIQASKVAITDSTNYVQLNDHTYTSLGWIRDEDSSNPNEPWYRANTLARDKVVSEWFDCQGDESFRVGMAISSNVKGPKTSGGTTAEYLKCGMLIQAQNSAGTNTWRIWNPYTSSSSAPEEYYTSVITLPSDTVRFRVQAHIEGYNNGVGLSGTFKVRKFTCFKMANANLIVDGAVTADKLAANSLTIGKMDSTLQSRVGKTITTATDLNTLRTTGIYYLKIGGNTNCPTTGHGKLEVNFDVGTPYQIWQPDSSTPAYYKRYYSNSTWSAWTTIDAVAAGKTATSYITDIDSKNGVIIKAVNGATSGSDTTKQNYVKLNASGLDIYQGGNSVAKYGADSRIGKENAQRIEIKNNTISMYENATDIAFQITSTGQINFGLEDGGIYIYERGLRSELMYNNNLWYSGYQSIAGTNPGIGSLAFWAGGHQKSYIGYNAEFAVGHNGLMKVNDVFQRPGRRTWVENGNLPTSGQPYTCVPFGLGSYVALGYLTNSAGSLRFSIPLGRTLPYDTDIESITFNMVVRAGNANGAGMYIVKKTSGGTDAVGFNSASDTVFYNGANISKTIKASMVTKTLYGQTNIYISLDSGSNDFFSGNSANTGYINNQPCVVHLSSILITPKYPANA